MSLTHLQFQHTIIRPWNIGIQVGNTVFFVVVSLFAGPFFVFLKEGSFSSDWSLKTEITFELFIPNASHPCPNEIYFQRRVQATK